MIHVFQPFKDLGTRHPGEALRNFLIELGVTQKDISVPLATLFSHNTKKIDDDAPRLCFIRDLVEAEILGDVPSEIELPIHPNHSDKGTRAISTLQMYSSNRKMHGSYRLKEFADIDEDGNIESVERSDKRPIIHWTSTTTSERSTLLIPNQEEIEHTSVEWNQTIIQQGPCSARTNRLCDCHQRGLLVDARVAHVFQPMHLLIQDYPPKSWLAYSTTKHHGGGLTIAQVALRSVHGKLECATRRSAQWNRDVASTWSISIEERPRQNHAQECTESTFQHKPTVVCKSIAICGTTEAEESQPNTVTTVSSV